MSMTINEDTFEQEVLSASLPVLLHFWAPWCGLCRMIMPLLNQFQRQWPDQVRVFDVNADENLKLANHYRLTTLPTLLFIQDGQVIQRFEGLRGREDFRRALESLMYRRQLEESLHK